jgi:4-carboxymuconolactone decarboxylase
VATDDSRTPDYSAALGNARRLLGLPLEGFLAAAPGEPDNGADFKRIATVHAFGDVWPRTEHLDTRSRALVSVAIAATLGTREPLRGQLRIAVHSGVTKAAIVEAFLQVAVYAGVATAFEGYQVATEVFGETPSSDVDA